MAPTSRKIVIIGAGIAGLCTAVYARRCGYEVELVEQHDATGGLATSWRRADYTFEGCLHWLVGTAANDAVRSQWEEVFDIDALTFVYPEEFVRLESEAGESLSIFADVDRMEAELLRKARQDSVHIRHFASLLRRFARLAPPDPSEPWPRKGLSLLAVLPHLPLLRTLWKLTTEQYGQRFQHKLLRTFFEANSMGELSLLTLIFNLVWMNRRNAAYVIGGSQAIIGAIRARFEQLGGQLRLGATVEKILVENGAAVGVQLAGGKTVKADWVISAADGHATIFELLGGAYADEAVQKTYRTLRTFPSYVQVSLGVAREFHGQAGHLIRVLDAPLVVDPGTELGAIELRFFHFDPTFAPRGRTAVTSFLPTRNFAYWVDLRRQDPARYQTEKQRVAEAVIAILERMVPDVRRAVEVVDVSTPATVIRYTNNWKGSLEGWLMTPATGFRPLRNTLPGLRQFLMAGQWIMPGGGLPSGVLTGRLAVRTACKEDRIPFAVR
jgi:phytoene dehydrogenase-like protein